MQQITSDQICLHDDFSRGKWNQLRIKAVLPGLVTWVNPTNQHSHTEQSNTSVYFDKFETYMRPFNKKELKK